MSKTSDKEATTATVPLLNIAEAAALLGMGESWMRQQKLIPFVRIGRRKLFEQAELSAFIEKNRKVQAVKTARH